MNIGALTQTKLQTGAGTAREAERKETALGFWEQVTKTLAAEKVEEIIVPGPATLELRLKARYPGLAYHVFDGSSRYWRCREDYPFHKIYQQDADVSEIENWRPSGPNPSQLDSKVQRNLGSIPPGSKAVIIHPKVQQKMEEDPDYAEVIYHRIEAWFTFDQARNEAILPGSTMGMSQCLAIGEDGQIANVQACSSGSFSRSRDKDEEEGDDFWTARAKRHHEYMMQVVEAQILHSMGVTQETAFLRRVRAKGESAATTGGIRMGPQLAAVQASQTAIAQTNALMNSPDFRAALGETVAGVSVDDVFQHTREAIAEFHPAAF